MYERWILQDLAAIWTYGAQSKSKIATQKVNVFGGNLDLWSLVKVKERKSEIQRIRRQFGLRELSQS
jgi:hypothetical protein